MAANTIILKRDCQNFQGIAGGVITPGDLIKRASDDTVVVHSTARGHCQKMFALENGLYGQTISDAYAACDAVPCFVARRGDIIYARIKASENIVIGDLLESAGDGTLQELTTSALSDLEYPNSIVGYARAATNVGTVARIAVEIA
jgi:hypothetical protein